MDLGNRVFLGWRALRDPSKLLETPASLVIVQHVAQSGACHRLQTTESLTVPNYHRQLEIWVPLSHCII